MRGSAGLVSEGLAQTTRVSIDLLKSHAGHGCCEDRGAERDGRPRGGRALVGISADPDRDDGRTALVLTLRCRAVNRCRCCGARKVKRDRARAFMGAAGGGRIAMVTLTIDPQDPRFADVANRPASDRRRRAEGRERPRTADLMADPRATVIEQSLRYSSWAWNRLRANMANRRALRGFAYMRGVELQRSGMAHLHVLVRVPDMAAYLALRTALRGDEATRTTVRPNQRAAGLAIMAGFGKVVDVQLARSRWDVARYVTKAEDAGDAAAYATKGVGAVMPRYTKRSAHSIGSKRMAAWAPGWVRPTPIAGFTWRVAKADASLVAAALAASDFHVGDPARYRVPTAVPAVPAGGYGG